jgi:hypothetical protein
MPEPFETRLRALAAQSVGRGCFFAALAIWCVMIGLIADPLQSIKAGAILALLVACVLLLKAGRAAHISYRKTELWLLLDRQAPLGPDAAQRIITAILREVYLRYALYATLMAIGFSAFALLLWLAPDIWPADTSSRPAGYTTGQHREIENFRRIP